FADPRGRRAHDAYHRFFPEARWQPSCLWQILAKLLIGIFYPTGTIAIDLDDTIFHRTGQKVQGAGYFRDAVRSTAKQVVYCWGLNLVVLTLRVKI
ncbi:MAG: transposase, partial [Phycisphaerae bacterium]|nr:transposase [Phycisphaerae bacterium]